MDSVSIKLLNCDKGISLVEFLSLDKNKLSPFEQKVFDALKEIYADNKQNNLFQSFPKRNIPLVIDCQSHQVKSGWTAAYSGDKNRIVLSHTLKGEDLKLSLLHELKHAEQWFDDSDLNNYQRHQAYCLYEVLAKMFIGQFLGRGAYYNISLIQALDKWFDRHYPNYKEKYDQQWPINKEESGLTHLPKSFDIQKKNESQILDILNKKVLK